MAINGLCRADEQTVHRLVIKSITSISIRLTTMSFVKKFQGNHGRLWPNHGIAQREVIVAIVCVLIALAIFVPQLLQSNAAARRTRCEFRLKRLGVAMHKFEAENGAFPGFQNEQATDKTGRRIATGWVFPLMPHMMPETPSQNPDDQGRISEFAGLHSDFSTSGSRGQLGESPNVHLAEVVCPAQGATGKPALSFVVNAGMPDATQAPLDWLANGIFMNRFLGVESASRDFIQSHDGEEWTLLISENVDAGNWTSPNEERVAFVWRANVENRIPTPGPDLLGINRQTGKGDGSTRFARPSSYHGRGVNCVRVDGSTTFIDERIDYLVLVQLMTPDDSNTMLPGSDSPAPPEFRRQ